MQLPKFAIQNSPFVLILVLLSLLLGLLSYQTMPRSEDPPIELPIYNIVAIYPGASPEDVEELVIDPLEEELDEIEEVDEIRTQIRDGVGIIRVEALFGVDIDAVKDDIESAVARVQPELPEQLYSLEVKQFTPLDVSILQLALVSEQAPYNRLLDEAERIEKLLEQVAGVRTVEVVGYPEEQIQVQLKLPRLAQLGVPLGQVIASIQGANVNLPAGQLQLGQRSLSLQTTGSFESLQQLKQHVIATSNGRMLRVQDVADVQMGYADARQETRYLGQRALMISVTQKEGVNILDLQARLDAKLAEHEHAIPPDMQLEKVFEQAPSVQSRIADFFWNLLQGILLVGVVVVLFLGFRSAGVVLTVIPTSVVMAIFLLDMAGFGIQQISIAGLVIALGLLVDNGIVVIENILRYRAQGLARVEAAIKGTSEVGLAIASSTMTTVLAFFPMTQLGGGTGEFLKTLPLIVIFALLASLLLALSFSPLLAAKLLGARATGPVGKYVERLRERVYAPSLRFALKRPLVIVAVAVLVTLGGVGLFPVVGVSFFPTADKPLLLIDVDLPEGSSLDATAEAVVFVEETLAEHGLVASYASSIGKGNPQVYYNRISENENKTHGQLVVNLQRWERASFYGLLDSLRSELGRYAGANITVGELKNGPPFEAPIEIKVLGENYDTLRALSRQVEGIIRAHPQTHSVDNYFARPKTQLHLAVNRYKAGLLGVSLQDFDLAVRLGLAGLEVGESTLEGQDKYPIVLRLPVKDRARLEHLNQVYAYNAQGRAVPVRQVAQLQLEPAIARIDHFNLARAATVTADVTDGDATAAITQDIIAELEGLDLPEGYSYYVAGELETQQESFGELGQVLLVALLGIFAVLVLQFRSLRQPFIVLSAIPLAFGGSIYALFITGYSFSFFAFVGFTSLVGVVVNTAIILIDFANQLRAGEGGVGGLSVREAIFEAAQTRFQPILLTTATTILGLLPLTLTNSGLWSPLGWTIIGGMLSSTLLSLLVVPILFVWYTRERVASPSN